MGIVAALRARSANAERRVLIATGWTPEAPDTTEGGLSLYDDTHGLWLDLHTADPADLARVSGWWPT